MMQNLRRIAQTLAIAFVVLVVQNRAASSEKEEPKDPEPQRYLLRYQFAPGEKLRYESVNQLIQQGVAAAGTKVDTTRIRQARLFTIDEVGEDGMAKASMQFEHVRMEIQSNDAEPEIYDSEMPAGEVPVQFRGTARKVAGAAPKYTLQPQGTPVSDEGIELTPKGGQASFMIPLPEAEVSVGETWKVNMMVTVRIASGVKRDIVLLRTYRLKNVEDDVATIGFSTSVLSSVKAPALRAQLLQATPQGEMLFDLKNGRLLRKEMRIDRMVIGALGPGTMLSAKGATVETLN